MWTHDVGEGFVEPEETGKGKYPPTAAEGKINGSPERKHGDVAEVRWVLFRGRGSLFSSPIYMSQRFSIISWQAAAVLEKYVLRSGKNLVEEILAR